MKDYVQKRREYQARVAAKWAAAIPAANKAWMDLWEAKWRPRWVVVRGKYYPVTDRKAP